MVRPFVFSVPTPRIGDDPAGWRDAVRRIEDLGLDAISISDHLTRGWSMEPIVTMTAALEATTRLRAVSLVLNNDLRHPTVLHKAVATLDVLSGGRVTLGLGAGWMAEDYERTGIAFEAPGVRIARLEESLEVLRGLFAGGPFSYVGEHHRVDGLDGVPLPTHPGGPPLLVGGGGPKLLRVAGRLADVVGINPRMREPVGDSVFDMTPERVGEKVAIVRDAACAAGRDPDALDVQVNVQWFALTDSDQPPWVSSMAGGLTDPALLPGSPVVLHGSLAQCTEQVLDARERFGISTYNVGGDPALVARLADAVRAAA